jgi:hypothetical protein
VVEERPTSHDDSLVVVVGVVVVVVVSGVRARALLSNEVELIY